MPPTKTRLLDTRIYRPTPRNLTRLARLLNAGELVAVPSETVYGLAANALDTAACEKIFAAKARPKTDPLIVHICELAQLAPLAHAGPIAQKLAKAFWPGPLTLVLPKTSAVPSIVTAGGDSVAVRMPQHPLFLELLEACTLPLAAPSANPFGYVSPTNAAHVKAGLGGKISAILDGGPSSIGIESTILDARDERRLRVLRPGAITAAQLSKVAGAPVGDFARPSSVTDTGQRARANKKGLRPQVAPGLLSRHYSPRTRVILYAAIPSALASSAKPDEALLYFSKPPFAPCETKAQLCWLTANNDQAEAARTLFAALRELDGKGLKTIHAELAPSGPLSTAINDRLRRAAATGQ